MSNCINTGLYVTFPINKPGVTQMENRYDLLIPEKTRMKFFENLICVHKCSVNDADRAVFCVLTSACSGLQASTNFWMYLVNMNEGSLAYQSYEDSMGFPKGFV